MTNKKLTTITYKTANETFNFNLPAIYSAFSDFVNFELLEGIAQIYEEWNIHINTEIEISDETYNVLATVMDNTLTLIRFYNKILFKNHYIKEELGIRLVGNFMLILAWLSPEEGA